MLPSDFFLQSELQKRPVGYEGERSVEESVCGVINSALITPSGQSEPKRQCERDRPYLFAFQARPLAKLVNLFAPVLAFWILFLSPW